MSGSGPSLFALFPSLEAAELARESLGQALELEGFESWCCGFTGAGGGGDSARIER
jgi:4-diphosphocytidyl-2-C-methyl-D-erythritol kinase